MHLLCLYRHRSAEAASALNMSTHCNALLQLHARLCNGGSKQLHTALQSQHLYMMTDVYHVPCRSGLRSLSLLLADPDKLCGPDPAGFEVSSSYGNASAAQMPACPSDYSPPAPSASQNASGAATADTRGGSSLSGGAIAGALPCFQCTSLDYEGVCYSEFLQTRCGCMVLQIMAHHVMAALLQAL